MPQHPGEAITDPRPVRLWRRFLAPHTGSLLLLFICQAIQALASLSLPSLSAEVIDKGILPKDQGQITSLGVVMFLTACVQFVFSTSATWLGARIAIRIGRELRRAVFAHVQGFSLAEMNRFGAPSLITRTTNDVQQIQTTLIMVLTLIMITPLMGFGAVAMAIRQDVRMSWLLFVTVPLIVSVVGVIVARTLPLFGQMQQLIDQVTQILREQITGLRVIRAFVRDEYERARFARTNASLTDTALATGRLMAVNMPAALIIMQGASVVMVWLAAGHIEAGTLEVGALVAFLSYIAHIMISTTIASMLFAFAPRAVVSARRIAEVLGVEPSVIDADSASTADEEDAHASGRSRSSLLRGSITFEHVSFAYPGAADPVLQNVSFRIAPGQTVGLIGTTGSGKSTIIHLIARLFDASAGRIEIGGQDIREIPLEQLWQQLGLVPQQSYLFSGSIADNLRYGRAEANDADLWQALGTAQAKDFVSALPLGLETPVAQGGTNFSGGQRQRLAIARALVLQPAIYLFDDSFSALDLATDARLRAALRRSLSRDATTLVVAQRVSSIQHADTILVLDRGLLVGSGRHAELLASCPTYAEIVRSQASQTSSEHVA